MGKYMRKGKGVGKLAVIEEALGVRTRARALALQRDSKHDNSEQGGATHTSTSSDSVKQRETCPSLECFTAPLPLQGAMVPTQGNYMELRSRRFEKVSRCSFTRVGEEAQNASLQPNNTLLQKQLSKCSNSGDESSKVHKPPHSRFARPEAGIRDGARQVSLQSAVDAGGVISRRVTPTASTSNSVSMSARQPLGILTRHQRQALASLASQEDMEVEAEVDVSKRPDVDMNAEGEQFFGESPMIAGPSDKNRHRRPTRESTPDSYAWSMEAPGSTSRTRRAGRSQGRSLSAPPFNRANTAPSTSEIEAFFHGAEQQERRRFIERYNFDPVNERPLRGRYEWTST